MSPCLSARVAPFRVASFRNAVSRVAHAAPVRERTR